MSKEVVFVTGARQLLPQGYGLLGRGRGARRFPSGAASARNN